ncbi:hypothetical protein D3C86_1873250 [compost metagenome]
MDVLLYLNDLAVSVARLDYHCRFPRVAVAIGQALSASVGYVAQWSLSDDGGGG